MEFDFKETVWRRVTVPKEMEEKVYKAIKEGKITSSYDIYDFIDEIGDFGTVENETLVDTFESMTPKENLDNPTLVVLRRGENIYDNVNELLT